MNNPQTVEEALDDICRCDLEADIGSVLHSTIVGFIKDDRLAHKTAMLEAIEGEKDRIDCCKTTCFSCEDSRFRNRTLDTMTAIINKIYE